MIKVRVRYIGKKQATLVYPWLKEEDKKVNLRPGAEFLFCREDADKLVSEGPKAWEMIGEEEVKVKGEKAKPDAPTPSKKAAKKPDSGKEGSGDGGFNRI